MRQLSGGEWPSPVVSVSAMAAAQVATMKSHILVAYRPLRKFHITSIIRVMYHWRWEAFDGGARYTRHTSFIDRAALICGKFPASIN